MNIWDILILLAVAAAVGIALRVIRGKKKTGGCSCGCGGCTKDCPSRRGEKTETGR